MKRLRIKIIASKHRDYIIALNNMENYGIMSLREVAGKSCCSL